MVITAVVIAAIAWCRGPGVLTAVETIAQLSSHANDYHLNKSLTESRATGFFVFVGKVPLCLKVLCFSMLVKSLKSMITIGVKLVAAPCGRIGYCKCPVWDVELP